MVRAYGGRPTICPTESLWAYTASARSPGQPRGTLHRHREAGSKGLTTPGEVFRPMTVRIEQREEQQATQAGTGYLAGLDGVRAVAVAAVVAYHAGFFGARGGFLGVD